MAAARDLRVAGELLRELPAPLDRLPYTPLFDAVHAEFVRRCGSERTAHEVWWTLLHARKSGRARPTRNRTEPSVP